MRRLTELSRDPTTLDKVVIVTRREPDSSIFRTKGVEDVRNPVFGHSLVSWCDLRGVVHDAMGEGVAVA